MSHTFPSLLLLSLLLIFFILPTDSLQWQTRYLPPEILISPQAISRTARNILVANHSGVAVLDPYWNKLHWFEWEESTPVVSTLAWEEDIHNLKLLNDSSTLQNMSSPQVPLSRAGYAVLHADQRIHVYTLSQYLGHADNSSPHHTFHHAFSCGTGAGDDGSSCDSRLFRNAMIMSLESPSKDGLYVTDSDPSLKRVRFMNFTTRQVHTVTSTSTYPGMEGQGPLALCTDDNDPNLLYITSRFSVWRINMTGLALEERRDLDESRAERIAGSTSPGSKDGEKGLDARFTGLRRCMLWKGSLFVLDDLCIREVQLTPPYAVSTYAGNCTVFGESTESGDILFSKPIDWIQYGNQLILFQKYTLGFRMIDDGNLWEGTPKHTCNDVKWWTTNVCSQHGVCLLNSSQELGDGECQCEPNYFSDKCELTTCDGVSSGSELVCSGHGQCIIYNNCTCDTHWTSSDRAGFISCDICDESSYRVGESCNECNCNLVGVRINYCNDSGICTECIEGYKGDKCGKCVENYFRPRDSICLPCDCHPEGSNGTCDPVIGVCGCRPGWYGTRCSIPEASRDKLRDIVLELLEVPDMFGYNITRIVQFSERLLDQVERSPQCADASCIANIRILQLTILDMIHNVTDMHSTSHPAIQDALAVYGRIANSIHASAETRLGISERMADHICNHDIDSIGEWLVDGVVQIISKVMMDMKSEELVNLVRDYTVATLYCVLKLLRYYEFHIVASAQKYTAAFWTNEQWLQNEAWTVPHGKDLQFRERISIPGEQAEAWRGALLHSIIANDDPHSTTYNFTFVPPRGEKKLINVPSEFVFQVNVAARGKILPQCFASYGDEPSRMEKVSDSKYNIREGFVNCVVPTVPSGGNTNPSPRRKRVLRHQVANIQGDDVPASTQQRTVIVHVVTETPLQRVVYDLSKGPRMIFLILAFLAAIAAFVLIFFLLLMLCHICSFVVVQCLERTVPRRWK